MKNKLREIRTVISAIGAEVLDLKQKVGTYPDYISVGAGAQCEIIANITLAFRHIEDARMRLGKAIQALDGGVSVYKD